jgi:hypothetical protein
MSDPPQKTFWETFDLIDWMCWGTIALVILLLLVSCFTPPPSPLLR